MLFLSFVMSYVVVTVLVLGGFIALSLANAIFVDEMASDNNDELMKELNEVKSELREIKEVLNRYK